MLGVIQRMLEFVYKERAFNPLEPIGLPFSQRGADMNALGIAQGGDKDIYPNPLFTDLGARLSEVYL